MQEADYAMTEMAHNLHGHSGRGTPRPGDDTLLVKFYIRQKQDKGASALEGRPIFKDVEYVDIRSPGNRIGGVVRPAREWDKTRFHKHYEAFKNKTHVANEGTPLEEWSPIPRSTVEEFKHFHIFTVEQLAGASDANLQQFLTGMTWKTKAQAYLATAGDAAMSKKLEDGLAERDAKIAALENKLENLIAGNIDVPAAKPTRQRKTT